jgi:hypothetical protein
MSDDKMPKQRSRPWGASLTIAAILLALYGVFTLYSTVVAPSQPASEVAQTQ